MEIDSFVDPCDMKACLQTEQPHNVEGQESDSTTIDVQQNDRAIRTIHLPKGAKEADILRAAAAMTNRATSVILEGINTSALFPHGFNKEGPITVEWEAGKNDPVNVERNRSEDSLLVLQAQTLIDLFHELFRTSSTPLQIVLEPQESGELVYLEQKLCNVESNLSQVEGNIGDSQHISNYQAVLIEDNKQQTDEMESKSGQISSMENLKQPEAPSTVLLIHRCYYCSFGSETVSVVTEHVKSHHPNKPVRTKPISGRNCPYCCVRLEQTAFFQHMRQYHGDAHPFRCGYCSFMGRDLNQVKHHCSKKHQEKPFKCLRRSKLLSSHAKDISSVEHELGIEKNVADSKNGRNLCGRRKDSEIYESVLKNMAYGDDVVNEEEGEAIEEVESSDGKFHSCPVCQKKIKTIKYLKVHMRVHSRGRYKCGYCSYLSVYFLQVLQHCKKRHKLLQPRVKHHELDPLQNKNVVKNIDKFMEEISKKCSRQPPDPDTRKWARKYSCPHCEYTCSYGASYRRHLTIHTSTPLPFQCKYCSFEGREKYYVRRHIQRIHRGLPTIVMENDIKNQLERSGNYSSVAVKEKISKDTTSKKVANQAKAISRNAGKPLKGAKRLHNSKIEISISPEIQQEEKKLGLETKVRESNFQGGEKEVIHSSQELSEMRDGISGTVEIKKILQVAIAPDSEVTRDGEKITPVNNEECLKSILEQPKSKKARSKKQFCKSKGYHKSFAENKDPILLPKGSIFIHSSVGLKLDTSEKIVTTSSECLMSDEISPSDGSVCIHLEGLLQGEGMEKNRGFADLSGADQTESAADNIGDKDAKLLDSSKTGKGKGNSRKKRGKEKSTHRAGDFVTYKDGKYTYCMCGTRTVNKAFYKHIKKHMDSKPFGCGYCTYRSIERAKVRVHHAFVHSGFPVIINEMGDDVKEGSEKSQAVETEQNLEIAWNSDDVSKHVPQLVPKQTSSPRSQVSVDFQCPICNKKITYHTYTIRRHFFSHYEYRPYQCGRCNFRGCSPSEVKQHSVYHGADLCPIVIPSGQEPPEGLEQLVADCFKEMRAKLEKMNSKKKKRKGAKARDQSTREQPPGYRLMTKEAISWQETLSRGECPWCEKRIPLHVNSEREKLLPGVDIKNHFKLHFYRSMEEGSSNNSIGLTEESSMSTDMPSSLEEKDAVIMNGLMYYFVHHPVITESDNMEFSKEKESLQNGEEGIISCPDGMPQGTIQITDSLLADLRFMLWGQEPETCLRKQSGHTGQKSNLNFESAVALQLHPEYQEPADSQQLGTKEPLRNSQYPVWDVADVQSGLQVQDTEVGILFLGEDVEMTTAVVVVNPEAGDQKDEEMEISI